MFEADSFNSNEALLERHIVERERETSKQGILENGIRSLLGYMWTSEKESLKNLRDLRDKAKSSSLVSDLTGEPASDPGSSKVSHQSYKSLDNEILSEIGKDKKISEWNKEVAHYIAAFAKTLPLFLNRSGYYLAPLVHTVDQVKLDSTSSEQFVDSMLGMSKGFGLKWGMDKFGQSNLTHWQKGMSIGSGSGFIESSLNRNTWYNLDNEKWQIDLGLKQTGLASFTGGAFGLVTFPLAAKLAQIAIPKAERIFSTTLNQQFLANTLVGSSFGFVSGSSAEFLNQIQGEHKFDPLNIFARGSAEAAVTGLAAASAWKLTNLHLNALQAKSKENTTATQDHKTASSANLDKNESLAKLARMSKSEQVTWLKEEPTRLLFIATELAKGKEIKPELVELVQENSILAEQISKADILKNLENIVLSPKFQESLDFLMNTGLMRKILPDLVELNGPRGEQDPVWHPEGNTWIHTKMVMKELKQRVEQLPQRQQYIEMLAALFHDVSKPETQKIWPKKDEFGNVIPGKVGISNHGHAELGVIKTRQILKNLGEKPDVIEPVLSIIHDHMRMHKAKSMDEHTLNALLQDPLIEAKIRLQASDALGTTYEKRLEGNLEIYLREKLLQYRMNSQFR